MTVLKTLGMGIVIALSLLGATSVGKFVYALPAAYENWQNTHRWLAEAIPGTKGTNGLPLNRSAVLDALVQQAIRQAAQQVPPGAKPPVTNAPAPTTEKPAAK